MRVPCYTAVTVLVLAYRLSAESTDFLAVPGIAGRASGTLVYSQRAEPKTFNPLISADSACREVIDRMTADLIHINRYSQQTEAALAKS